MATSTDGYKTQIALLINFFFTRQETIVNQWWAKYSLDERHHTRTSFSQAEFRDQHLALLHNLTQRIAGDSRESDLVEKAGQYGLHRWQHGCSLADLFAELANFYDVLDEEIQQFLVLHPQTQPRIIAHTYRQLVQLSKDVHRGSLQYVDRVGQTGADEQIKTLEIALASLQQQIKQLLDQLRQSSHDLRSHLGIISTAASLLQQPLKNDDQVRYMDMLNRNVNSVDHLLNKLLQYARREEDKPTPRQNTTS